MQLHGSLEQGAGIAALIGNPQSINPSSGRQRVQSRFHTLHLAKMDDKTIDHFFGVHTDFISLFEILSIDGEVDLKFIDAVGDIIVNQKMITCLKVNDCSLEQGRGEIFAEMLHYNCLQSMEINAKGDHEVELAHELAC